MTRSNWISAGLVAVVGAGVVVACAKDERETMTPASGVAPRFTARETADSIAHERCQRLEECGAFTAADAEYENFDDCKQKFRADYDQKFGGDSCANGVGDRELRECLSEISDEDCSGVSGVIDSMDRYLACRPGKLCLN
jgi:hypothetical protein